MLISIYLDPVLLFWGCWIINNCTIIAENIKRLYRLWKKNIDKSLVALMVAFTIMIFIHGMLDYTIFFVQTGFLYLLVASSFDIYKESLDA